MSATDDRLAAIEARQRLYEQHDPTCATVSFLTDELLAAVAAGAPPAQCNCWLSEGPTIHELVDP